MTVERTMQAFGLYLILGPGLGLMLLPHVFLGLFGLSAGDDTWIRVVGMTASVIGAYYLVAAAGGHTAMYRWSVALRLYAALVLIVLFVLGKSGAGIVLFAIPEIAGAGWTWWALRAMAAARQVQ